jgi:hypothetical protein
LGIESYDDKSEVEKTFSVGTFSGGSDVSKNEPLGGDSVIHNKVCLHN